MQEITNNKFDSDNELKGCIEEYVRLAIELWQEKYEEKISLKDFFEEWPNWTGGTRVFLNGGEGRMRGLSSEMDEFIKASKTINNALLSLLEKFEGFTRGSFECIEETKEHFKETFLPDFSPILDCFCDLEEAQYLGSFLDQAFCYKIISTFGPVYFQGEEFKEQYFFMQSAMLSSSLKEFILRAIKFYLREIEQTDSLKEKGEIFSLIKNGMEEEGFLTKRMGQKIFQIMSPSDDIKSTSDKLKEIEEIMNTRVLITKKGKSGGRDSLSQIRRGSPMPMNNIFNRKPVNPGDIALNGFFSSNGPREKRKLSYSRACSLRGNVLLEDSNDVTEEDSLNEISLVSLDEV